jgi:hypothetical protein
MRTVERPDSKPVRKWKWWGAGMLAVPLAIVTLFAVGEGFGGEEGWWGHLIQLAVGLAFLAGAWLYPRIGGPALIAVGTVLTGVWLGAGGGDEAGFGVVILLLPMVLAGVFFTLAGYGRQRDADT